MKILVVGDVMLDRYWFCDVDRLSQEAPVPVAKMVREEKRAGAAANVAMNCQAMGCETSLLSITGQDEPAYHLENLLKEASVEAMLIAKPTNTTTQKIRVIGKNQQIVRVDNEANHGNILALSDYYAEVIESVDIVIFSDYGKGALGEIERYIRLAKSLGKTVLIDPKGFDYTKYEWADLIKPNVNEMRELVGGWSSKEQLIEKAFKLQADGKFKAILLTMASDGLMLIHDKRAISIPAQAKEVFDVTGAGDVCIAAFAVGLTKGFDYETAAKYANKAAGISVGRFGTAVIKEEEVFDAAA